jgi:two-component system cell cycle sensor histidine kinase PleC
MSEITAEMIERGAGSDPVAQRRRRDARRLRELRLRMGADHLDPDPEHEKRDLWIEYAAARRKLWGVAAVLIAAAAAIVAVAHGLVLALVWGAAALSGQACVALVAAALLGRLGDPAAPRRWGRRVLAAEAMLGLIWASPALLSSSPAVAPALLTAMLSWSGFVAISAMVVPPAIYAALSPMALALALCAARSPDVSEALGYVAALVAQAAFVAAVLRLRVGAREGLAFRRRKDALIAELEQATAESDEARRRAEAANVAKSQFLATMSHELRTPLNAILGFSEVMEKELFGPHAVPAYREYAADIHASGEHLLNLINEILDLSRVEAGRYDLREEPVGLGQVVEECETLVAMRARAKNIALSLSIAPDLPRLWADERALRQIALNLLSNAVKFTPAGGAVTVKVGWTASGGQYLSVKDNGPGIPEAELPLVMTAFGRGDMALRKAEEGAGLGLPIVKGLVELHGGAFTLKSRLREGTEAIVVLPAERALSPLSPLATDDPPPKRRA